jgi:hypothetical protein
MTGRAIHLVIATLIMLTMGHAGAQPVRVTGDARLVVKGNFCNLLDADGRVIYTPALPGASDAVFRDWMRRQAAAGSTHTFFGAPGGGEAYPGVEWKNPDYWRDLPALRAFIERILDTPAADGRGFRPVLFVGGDRFADAHFDQWPALARALDGLHQFLILVPAWEPVQGGWTSAQLSAALTRLHELFPAAALAWHGSPGRWSGASDPLEPDDPWKGDERAFYTSHGGEWIDLVLYQTPHGGAVARDCRPDARDCWLQAWRQGLVDLGTGRLAGRRLRIALFETVAFEFFRRQATSEDARTAASRAGEVCRELNVTCGFGNGLPRSAPP